MPATNYIWDVDNDSYLSENNDDLATVAAYTNEPIPFGALISQRRTGTSSYFHFDPTGSTSQLTNAHEAVSNSYSYRAFGEALSSTGNTNTPFLYLGELGYYADAETDGYYVRARIYRPSVSRWLSRDPVAPHNGASLYKYVDNNPLLGADPSGLFCVRPKLPRDVSDNFSHCPSVKLSNLSNRNEFHWVITNRNEIGQFVVQKVEVSGNIWCSTQSWCIQTLTWTVSWIELWRLGTGKPRSDVDVHNTGPTLSMRELNRVCIDRCDCSKCGMWEYANTAVFTIQILPMPQLVRAHPNLWFFKTPVKEDASVNCCGASLEPPSHRAMYPDKGKVIPDFQFPVANAPTCTQSDTWTAGKSVGGNNWTLNYSRTGYIDCECLN